MRDDYIAGAGGVRRNEMDREREMDQIDRRHFQLYLHHVLDLFRYDIHSSLARSLSFSLLTLYLLPMTFSFVFLTSYDG